MASSEVNNHKRAEMASLVQSLLSNGHTARELASLLRCAESAIGRYKRGASMGTNADREALRCLCERNGLSVGVLS
jgi:hypothetical protein